MENTNAQKLVKEIISGVETNGIQTENLVENLQKLREYALEEGKPAVTKSIRLAYEHLEANNDFLVSIPSDEPLEDEETVNTESTNVESLYYLLNLYLDTENRHNIDDIKAYNKMFLEF
ncbi:hypothetical protein AB4865_09415 [Capnocytophaga sp. ARDL2]|uniref:hypothetical protein n=1 Tax=Capnocytophaga sp. ARDL2 TaxID=3238809 RepID=UPI003558A34A